MQDNTQEKQNRLWRITGWILFLLCALLYLVDSIRAGNNTLIMASIVFMLACFAFIIPLARTIRNSD